MKRMLIAPDPTSPTWDDWRQEVAEKGLTAFDTTLSAVHDGRTVRCSVKEGSRCAEGMEGLNSWDPSHPPLRFAHVDADPDEVAVERVRWALSQAEGVVSAKYASEARALLVAATVDRLLGEARRAQFDRKFESMTGASASGVSHEDA